MTQTQLGYDVKASTSIKILSNFNAMQCNAMTNKSMTNFDHFFLPSLAFSRHKWPKIFGAVKWRLRKIIVFWKNIHPCTSVLVVTRLILSSTPSLTGDTARRYSCSGGEYYDNIDKCLF